MALVVFGLSSLFCYSSFLIVMTLIYNNSTYISEHAERRVLNLSQQKLVNAHMRLQLFHYYHFTILDVL